MYEFVLDYASHEELLAEAKRLVEENKRLQDELETAQNKLIYTEKAFQNRDRQHSTASSLVQEMIEDKTITDPTMLKALCECLDVTATRTVEFTLTIEVTGTMDMPFDEEPDDGCFGVEGITYNGEWLDLDSEDITLDGWNEV